MAIVVTCPACGKKGRIPENFQGSEIRCPACKARFGVEPKTTLTMSEIGTTTRSNEPKSPENREFGPVKSKRSKGKLWLLVLGAIACFVLYFPIRDWLYPNYGFMGYQARQRGDLADAERYYTRAVDQGGSDEHMAVSLAGLGRTYLDMNRYREAEEFLGRSAEYYVRLAKRKGPQSVWVWMAAEEMEDLGKSQMSQASANGDSSRQTGVDVMKMAESFSQLRDTMRGIAALQREHPINDFTKEQLDSCEQSKF